MKRIFAVMMMVCCWQAGHAQTFSEWFRQKRTQIRYLVNQIGALQVYIEYARKGYEIAEAGLSTIGNIKEGDLNLHRDFFAALGNVPPAIRNSASVADIVGLQIKIIQVTTQHVNKAKQSTAQLSIAEIDYIVQVYFRLLENSADNIDELARLLSPGAYVMTDDERLKRIEQLQQDMQEKYGFAKWFGDEMNILVLNRRKAVQDGQIGSKLMTDK